MERVKALIAGTRTYFREVLGEMSKVAWPSVERTAKLTGVVLGLVALVGVFMYILDIPLGYGLQKLAG
jgi:preprotein translocase SecE subunit